MVSFIALAAAFFDYCERDDSDTGIKCIAIILEVVKACVRFSRSDAVKNAQHRFAYQISHHGSNSTPRFCILPMWGDSYNLTLIKLQSFRDHVIFC